MEDYKGFDEENEDIEPNTITLEDEEGQEHLFEIIDSEEIDGETYMALVPYIESEDVIEHDDELLVLKVDSREECDYLIMIEDKEEFDKVTKIFIDKLSEDYDIK